MRAFIAAVIVSIGLALVDQQVLHAYRLPASVAFATVGVRLGDTTD